MSVSMISDEGRDLFRQALEDFRLHPEKHKQETWICETGCCLAGNVVLLSGALPLRQYAWEGHPQWSASMVESASGLHRSVRDEAARLLGISWNQSLILFDSSNTIDDLELMYKALDAGEPLAQRCPECSQLIAPHGPANYRHRYDCSRRLD